MKITELLKKPDHKPISTFVEGEKDEKASPHKYKIVYTRKGCVGGDICTFIDPDHFLMAKDGKAIMLKGKDAGGNALQADEKEGKFVIELEDPGMGDIGSPMRRAADSCPAGVIRVIQVRTGNKVAGH